MTRRAKPKRNKSGRGYVGNRARAKSGLNRSMLNVSLARLGTYIKYKANDACKATLEIPPYNSSRECHVCHKTNTIRPQQDTLICLNGCGTFHADENAGKVLQYRTIKYIKERKFADKAKPRKTIINRKKTLVSELTSVKKSGMIEVVSHDTPPGRYGTQAGIRPSSEGISRGKIKSCLEQRTGPSSVLETR